MKVYEKIYEFYLNQILNHLLEPGAKMPSIRETEDILGYSRTSIETAYQQLAADGYIYSVEKVGYYVSDMVDRQSRSKISLTADKAEAVYKYDLATIGEDKTVSCIELWRRYMKSALRQEDRLLDYPTSQGEADLREMIAIHVRKTRNIICSPEDVVIGAGFQNLLPILIALIPGEKTISFPTSNFSDAAFIFENAGFQVSYRNKESHVIYVTPSYMTKWGEVMTMKRRHELVDHALKHGHLIIEDDYQNDFIFSGKPTPSLYAMTGGVQAAFLGSFSRVLLPSVRISFLILPAGTRKQYEQIKGLYNQTASMAEQIALTQFLRDGHLGRHIKKLRKCYANKRQIMINSLRSSFKDRAEVIMGDSGMEIGICLLEDKMSHEHGDCPVKYKLIKGANDKDMILLSCSRVDVHDIEPAIEALSKYILI